jgi:hypothetical protein
MDCGEGELKNKIQTLWYIKDLTRLFASCSEDELQRIVNALSMERLRPNPTPPAELATPAYLFPIVLDAKWNRWPDIPVSEDGRYGWVVDDKPDPVETFAGAFEDCYNISLRTTSDVTMRRICPEVGLVSFLYRHFGSTSDFYGELLNITLTDTP